MYLGVLKSEQIEQARKCDPCLTSTSTKEAKRAGREHSDETKQVMAEQSDQTGNR